MKKFLLSITALIAVSALVWVIDGQIVIVNGDKKYNLQGVEIK